MTCIVGLSTENGVVIGGDSAGVAGWYISTRADEKVFTRGPFIMGFTGSFRMGQLLRYTLDTPAHPDGMPDAEYMTIPFINAVRECLEEGGWKKTKDERESGGTFIVSYRGRVYEVQSDFQLGIPGHGYTACGCGFELALGSLHSTEGMLPKDRVYHALEAAETFSAGVQRPFILIDSLDE